MIKHSQLTKDRYRAGEVADLLGLSSMTIKNYMTDGKIEYVRLPTSNHRRITKEQLIKYLKENGNYLDDRELNKHDIIYARVSSHSQKDDLERQKQELINYMIDKNPINLQIIEDIGSGLNDNRKGLNKLIKLILEGKVNRVIISYKDRLTRFGFNYIKQICDYNNVEIIVISREERNESLEVELAEDIISIIHSFSGKLYGMRKKVKEEVDKELKV